MFTSLLLVVASQVQAGQSIDDKAKVYLASALKIIQGHSIKKGTDWRALEVAAYEKAKSATAPKDTYPAIKAALQSLGDHHSFLIPAEESSVMKTGKMKVFGVACDLDTVCDVLDGSPAQRAGIKMGMRIKSVNDIPITDPLSTWSRIQQAQDDGGGKLTFQDVSGKRITYSLKPESVNLLHDPRGMKVGKRYGFWRYHLSLEAVHSETTTRPCFKTRSRSWIKRESKDGSSISDATAEAICIL